MAKTRHIQRRISQRSIQYEMLEIVKSMGKRQNDKIILNKKGIDSALNELNKVSKSLQKMRSRGGIVLIEKDGFEITTYPLR